MYTVAAEKFKRAFLDVLECRCWHKRQSNNSSGAPVQAAETRYLATWRRSPSPYAADSARELNFETAQHQL